MEILSKKDGSKSFIIIKEHEMEENDYKLQMLINNSIDGVVSFKIRNVNNKKELWYDTTSLITMENMYSRKLMSGDDIYNLVRSIKLLSDNMKEYLLDINNVIFSQDMIFLKRGQMKYWFCYCPGKEGYFCRELRIMFDDLLGCINHNDKKAVKIAYGIQQITIGDDFSIAELMDCANKVIRDEEKTIESREDICEKKEVEVKTETKKKNIFLRMLEKITKQNQYQTYENEDFIYEESSYKAQSNQEPEEDMTVLLTDALVNGIRMRSLNIEEEIVIKPRTFPCVVGNSLKSSDIHINSQVVSRVHMRISEEMGEYFIEDLNSTNGTFINSERIRSHQIYKIEIGDVITIANLEFMVE